ncbi:MAG: hypothetical protein QXL16_01730 [Candidatus Micrarchaeaceae archaeon]
MEEISVSVAENGRRLLTQVIYSENAPFFYLFERTKLGSLITKFTEHGEILNQSYLKGTEIDEAFSKVFGKVKVLKMESEYSGIKINAKCRKCGKRQLVRELDLKRADEIEEVPVIPIFLCSYCGSKHFILSDSYMEILIEDNKQLFDKEELKELEKDKSAFIKTLQEYVSKVFASKKILRVIIENDQ